MKESKAFDPNCRRCPRLASFLAEVRQTYPEYHGRPVAAFGDANPSLLIVGLAPGLHGANATGRPFTGDFAGILLYNTLYEHGFSNRPESAALDDGLCLHQCRITNAVKCVPPQNKPVGSEIAVCNAYLRRELQELRAGTVVLALGTIAHGAVLRALDLPASAHKFSHGAAHTISNRRWLLDSYHCSRYNTQTRRLTKDMFREVFRQAVHLLKEDSRKGKAAS